jgi:hypothetical protein
MSNVPSHLCFVTLVAGATVTFASDRIKVIVPSAGQKSAEQLAESLASACNCGDYLAFIDHFTPRHRRRCQHIEDMFITGQPRMDIKQITLLSEDSDRITFAVKYAWHDRQKPERLYASKVTARRIDGDWKLDGETLRTVMRAEVGSFENASDSNAPTTGWDPLNPPAHLVDRDLAHLRGDVGIRPGQGCANGRCGK